MNLVDPSGLLQRVPELAPVASLMPSISEALRTGRPHKVYRALWWASLLGRVPEMHRAQVRQMLGHRRLFLEPAKGAPSMMTLNGVGTRIYGSDEQEGDGLGIGVHFIVFLFIPVFPLSAWLYRSEGRQYQFYGRAPLGGLTWVWRNGLLAVAALGVAAAGFGAWHASRHASVWVVNALPVPVEARIGAATLQVPASDKARVEVDAGPQHVVIATSDGATFEEGDLDARAGADVVAWSVGGLAPLFVQRIVYSEHPTENDGPPLEVLCGQRALVRDDMDYVLTDPPDSISLPSGSSSVTRTALTQQQGDWSICLNWAISSDAPAGAARTVADALVNPTFGKAGLSAALSLVTVREGFGDLPGWLKAHRFDQGDLETQRIYQGVMESAGHLGELREDYAARYQAKPDDLDAAYLYARLLESSQALQVADRALGQGTYSASLARTRIFSLYELGRYEDAVAAMVELRQKAPDEFGAARQLWLESNAALGRFPAAAEGCTPAADADEDDLVACRRLAALGRLEVPSPIQEEGQAPDPAIVAARLGEPVDLSAVSDEIVHAQVEIVVGLAEGPDAALERFRQHADIPGWLLDGETALVLFGAAVAEGDKASADRLRNPFRREPAWKGLLAFVESGERRPELDDASGAMRALAELMRSRMPGVEDSERAALIAAAKRDDLLHGAVALGLARWKT